MKRATLKIKKLDKAASLKYHVLYEDRRHRGRKAILLSRRETAQEAALDCEKFFRVLATMEGQEKIFTR